MDHVDGGGTHAAMIYKYPEHAARQGVEDWLRYVARRPQLDNDVRVRVQAVLLRRHGSQRQLASTRTFVA